MALRSGLSYPLQLSAENMLKDLQDFVNDISAIVKAWEQSLKADPSEIWNDVTAFTPSRFFVQTSASSVQRIKSCQEVISNSKERPMFTVSKTSVGMTQLAVLSIWPSR